MVDTNIRTEVRESMEIPIGNGYFAVVDADDYPRLSQFLWSVKIDKRDPRRTPYAQTNIYGARGQRTTTSMHRLLLGDACAGLDVDHINRNGLDNRRCNLRVVSHAVNCRNRPKNRTNTSGYRCVSWHRRDECWQSWVWDGNRQVSLGYFDTAEEAAHAYDEAAVRILGDLAQLNFPKENN